MYTTQPHQVSNTAEAGKQITKSAGAKEATTNSNHGAGIPW